MLGLAVSDEFNFHLPRIPSTPESETEWQARVSAVEQVTLELFKAVCDHLGERWARSLFCAVAPSVPRKRSRSSLYPNCDTLLIREYDRRPEGENPRQLAVRLARDKPHLFGFSPKAIVRRLRML